MRQRPPQRLGPSPNDRPEAAPRASPWCGGLAALSAAALLAALAPACGQEDGNRELALRSLEDIIATCSATSGSVQVKRRGEGFWGTAPVGAVFRPGDWLRAGGGAYARVEFLGSGALELDENAIVILDAEESPGADGGLPGERTALVALESGAVRGVMQALDGGTARPLLFATADGERGQLEATQGTGPVEFTLTRRERKTEVAVNTGEATLAFSGQRRTLKSGIIEEVELGKLVEVVLLRPPSLEAPRADARMLFSAAKPVPLRWDRVDGAASYRVQIAHDPGFRSLVESREVIGPELGFAAKEASSYSWRIASRDANGRLGVYSSPRRLHLETSLPVEHLLEPERNAVFGYAGDPVRVAFRWRKASGILQYRLVIARGQDLDRDRVASETVDSDHGDLGALTPGTYYWGVYAVDEDWTRPLFLQPRPLVVRKVAPSTLLAPKKVQRWGD